ncbi:unnamed protein product [Caenorhabditis sp. 36 PRJEB53466]|nr:unnamed protein product [Caenorhabditis sp. 36 PRJEB53466]
MTTEDFNVLIRSMEGQFQIILPRPWARESDLGGVQRMLADDPITVRNRKLEAVREGRVNSNSKNETLSAICAYTKCTPAGDLPCVQSFVPFGHCCPVCGARIELIAFQMDYELAKRKIDNVLEDMKVKQTVHATLERANLDVMTTKYEVSLVTMANASFDEDFYDLASRRIVTDLALSLITHHQKSILDFTIHLSKVDRTIRTVSKIVACVIYFTILIVLVGAYAYQNLELRVSRRTMFSPVIKYKRQTDQITIELEDVSEMEVETVHDDVDDQRNVNPNFEEEPTDEGPVTIFGANAEEIEMIPWKNFPEAKKDEEDFEVEKEINDDKKSEEAAVQSVDSHVDLVDVEDQLNINPNFEKFSSQSIKEGAEEAIFEEPKEETSEQEPAEQKCDTIIEEREDVTSEDDKLIDL